ncbi:ABC transporter permease [Phytoactinopolyspora mesophila]|uniref:Transport permease protein n=1 Tax=Phytoactinopolyspora mesophila TaxID=2650750 RepID=A0A7K3LZY7_9ACTN|nr:ABC transporter permease [Phytoactinopolyspora mesophila]NDL56560.1 ABC transporter permease [Phytoactinopolyspora mesophila]
MTTRTSTAPGTGMSSRSILAKVAVLEAKLMLRDGATVFFGLIFPTLLLVGLGLLLPDFQEPTPDLGGLRPVDVYAPVALTLAMATVAVTILPAYLAAYRADGVLRRLATTPASPSVLLNAQLVVNTVILAIGSLLAFASAVLILDVEWPSNIVGTLVAFAAGTIACFSVGLLIAAVAKNGRAASAIGMSAYFPFLFFAGVWTPGDAMPSGVRAIADFTPTGAAVEAMSDAWIEGGWPSALHLTVLLAWTVVMGFIASRTFRWE